MQCRKHQRGMHRQTNTIPFSTQRVFWTAVYKQGDIEIQGELPPLKGLVYQQHDDLAAMFEVPNFGSVDWLPDVKIV